GRYHRSMRKIALGALVASLLSGAGCSLIALDGFSGGEDPGGDGGGPVSEAGGADTRAAGSSGGGEAGTDAPSEPAACDATGRVAAKRAFDIAAASGVKAGCSIDNVLVEDGMVAGLDRSSGDQDTEFAGEYVIS